MHCKSIEGMWNFLTSHRQRRGNELLSTSYWRGSLADTNALISGSSYFKCHTGSQSFWNSLPHCLVTLLITSLQLVTTTAFLTPPIYYKLQNAQWSDEYSVHSMNLDSLMMYEMHVTVKLYRVENSFCNAASHFFSNQRNSCSCILLKICTTAQLYIGTNIRLWEERRSMKFKENWC